VREKGLCGAAVDGEQLVAQRRVPGGQIVPTPLREVVAAVAGEQNSPHRGPGPPA
jgi:hypothetical protein